MKYYNYAVKIHDSLRSGTQDENPLYIATAQGIYIDEIECAAILYTPGNITTAIQPTESKCSVSSVKFKVGNPAYAVSEWFYERQLVDGTLTYGEKVELYAIGDGELLNNGNAEIDKNSDYIPDGCSTWSSGSPNFTLTSESEQAWTIEGEASFEIEQLDTDDTQESAYYQDITKFVEGTEYTFSGMLSAHRCSTYLRLEFYNSSDTLIDYEDSSPVVDTGYPELRSITATPPTGTTRIRCMLYKTGTMDGEGYWTSYLFADNISLTGKSLKLIYTGILRDFDNDELEIYYTFEISDFQDRLKTSIFDREFSTYSTETLSDINTYRLPYYMDESTRMGFKAIEQDEGDTDDNGTAIDTRVITFTGHVIEFVRMMYQIIFSTDTLAVQASYLSDDWEDFVDTGSLDAIETTLSDSAYNFYLEFREPIKDPYEFLNEHIYKPCAIFPRINSEGKLALKLHAQPTSDENVLTLHEGNIISIDSKEVTDEDVVNHIQVYYGWKFKNDEASTMRYFADSTSYNKFKMLIPRDSPQKINIKGINYLSSTDRATFAQNLVDSFFARYSLPLVRIGVTVPLEVVEELVVGDYIFVYHNHVVAWEGDTAGTPGIGEAGDGEDPFGGIAYFDEGISWGAFLNGNNLGKAIDGTWIITTTEEEIQVALLNDTTDENFLSCLENHNSIDSWLDNEGGF